jgi:hypothetical protein
MPTRGDRRSPLPTRPGAVTATAFAPATAAYTAFRQSKVPRRILESRGEPAGFAGGVPSREGLGTLSGFPSQRLDIARR